VRTTRGNLGGDLKTHILYPASYIGMRNSQFGNCVTFSPD
jgi:hypothetical protein